MDYTEESRDVESLITFHCVGPLVSKWEMVKNQIPSPFSADVVAHLGSTR